MQLKTGKVLLYSGGMDSFVLSRLYDYDTCLYIYTKSAYDDAQLSRIVKNPPKNLSIDCRLQLGDCQLDDDPTATVPARNLLFITIASYYGNEIHFGATKNSRHADKDPYFVNQTEMLLNHIYDPHDRKIRIVAPFQNYTKQDILDKWYSLGGTMQQLHDYTFTCYTPILDRRECGTCPACLKKREIFKQLYS